MDNSGNSTSKQAVGAEHKVKNERGKKSSKTNKVDTNKTKAGKKSPQMS